MKHFFADLFACLSLYKLFLALYSFSSALKGLMCEHSLTYVLNSLQKAAIFYEVFEPKAFSTRMSLITFMHERRKKKFHSIAAFKAKHSAME